MSNIVSKDNAISFLVASKSCIQESDFDEILPNLIKNLYGHLKRIPKSLFERNLFYYHATKILCLYGLYEELSIRGETLIDIIAQTHKELISDKHVCTNISFRVNLLQYNLCHEHRNITKLANATIKYYFSNMVLETLNLEKSIDAIYNLNKLQLLNKESGWTSLRKRLSSLLFNKESYLYKESRLTLSRLKGGIPRLLLMECLSFQNIRSIGHHIMLK